MTKTRGNIQSHIHLTPLKSLLSWSDLAGVIALLAALSIGYVDHSLYSWEFLILTLLIGIYFFVTWGIEVDDHFWLQNFRLLFLTAIPIINIVFDLSGWTAVLMLFILSATAMYAVTSSHAYYWICGFGLIVGMAYLTVWSHTGSILVALGTFGGFLFIGSAAESQMKAIQASEESQRLFGELQNAHQQLQEQADQAEELAAINERNHLAREVHDSLGHQLTVAAVQLEGAQKLIQRDPAKAEAMVATVREQVLEGLSELRRTIATLRAPIEEDLSLPTMLGRLVENFEEATDIKTELSLPPSLPELPSAHRQTIFRAVQEALTNIQKHAHAQSAQIRLFVQGQPGNQNAILLSIRDDGIGISEKSRGRETGFGLRGMNERVSQLDGTISIHDGTTGGTEVLITIPILAANGIPKEKARAGIDNA